MDPLKRWQRYTKVADIFVNMLKYNNMTAPTDTGCLEWRGPRHRQGYGMIGVLNSDGHRKMTVVHRVAMRMKLNRELTTEEDVRHSCGNLACCNPAHLYIRNEQNNDTTKIVIPQISSFAE